MRLLNILTECLWTREAALFSACVTSPESWITVFNKCWSHTVFVPSVLSVSFASSVWFQSPWTGWGFGVVAKWHSAEERWQSARTQEEFECTHSTIGRQDKCVTYCLPLFCWNIAVGRVCDGEREREPVVVGVRTKQPATRGLGCGTQFDEAPNQVWSLNASASLHGFICGCSWVSSLNMLWIQTEIFLSHRAVKAAPKGWPRCLVYIFVNHRGPDLSHNFLQICARISAFHCFISY